MIKLLVLSDLHLEFAGFEPDMDAAAAADVVVLAGDIHPGVEGIRWARAVFPGKPIVYVAGNHEFYGHHWTQHLDTMRDAAKVNDVHFLENDAVTIAGVRFLGCSLWTDFEYFGQYVMKKMMYHAEQSFSDYQVIGALDPGKKDKLTAQMTLQRHRESRAWLETELPKGDPGHTVVVTHHYPHKNSTAQKYVGDALTAIFGSHMPLEMMLQAGLWIHGHAHSSCNYRLDGAGRNVRVVCNPRGYPLGWTTADNENPQFDPGLLISSLPDGSWGNL